ncbi:MAG: transposase [Flavobacteriales bacterium]|nr:transposase [Flavobacteriales bacterium]
MKGLSITLACRRVDRSNAADRPGGGLSSWSSGGLPCVGLMLQNNGITISMTENGDPLENAVAERLNGILKQEYLDLGHVDTIEDVRVELDRAVFLYNTQRPHASISMFTPDHVHNNQLHVQRSWKNYYKKRTTVNPDQDETITVNLSSDIKQNL